MHACPPNYNPATYMLDVLAGSDSTTAALSGIAAADAPAEGGSGSNSSSKATAPGAAAAVADAAASSASPAKKAGPILSAPQFQEAYFASPLWTGGVGALALALSSPQSGATPLKYSSPRARNFCAQFAILTQRLWKMYLRNIPMNAGRIGALAALCILFGTIYFNIYDNSSGISGTQTLISAIFMTAGTFAPCLLELDIFGHRFCYTLTSPSL